MTKPEPPAAALPGTAPGTAGPADVLVARDPERAAGLLTLLRERGLSPVAAPVIERAPTEDLAELDAARERLADGAYAWVAITSVNAVQALLGPTPAMDDRGAADDTGLADGTGSGRGDTTSAGSVAQGGQRLLRATDSAAPSFPPADTPGWSDTQARARPVAPGSVRWAAVGPATRQALTEHGVGVDLVPADATGAGLAEAFPAAPSSHRASDPPDLAGHGVAPRVLLPLGNLASDTLRDGLEAKGWTVDVVTAYRTVTRALPPELRRRYDVVVVASGSAARQVAAQLGPQRVVAIGEPSARAAGDVGHTVLAVAGQPTDAALADAVLKGISRTGSVSRTAAVIRTERRTL